MNISCYELRCFPQPESGDTRDLGRRLKVKEGFVFQSEKPRQWRVDVGDGMGRAYCHVHEVPSIFLFYYNFSD